LPERLICLDVDGTLIRSNRDRPNGIKEYCIAELLPRRRRVVQKLAEEGCSFALITNQAGVAMGYVEPLEVYRKLGKVVAHFDGFFGRPFSIHVCMHHPAARIEKWREDPCPRRKPGPGMLEEAMAAHEASLRDVTYVGDETKDLEAAQAAGVAFDDAEHFFHHAVRLHA
jgi:D-glycero-D-manno-heptose 1,7-bisphosphate phosphatase